MLERALVLAPVPAPGQESVVEWAMSNSASSKTLRRQVQAARRASWTMLRGRGMTMLRRAPLPPPGRTLPLALRRGSEAAYTATTQAAAVTGGC